MGAGQQVCEQTIEEFLGVLASGQSSVWINNTYRGLFLTPRLAPYAVGALRSPTVLSRLGELFRGSELQGARATSSGGS